MRSTLAFLVLLLASLVAFYGTAPAQVHGGPAFPGTISCGGASPPLPNLPPRPQGCSPGDYAQIQAQYSDACRALRASLCQQLTTIRNNQHTCQELASDQYQNCIQAPGADEEACLATFNNNWVICEDYYTTELANISGLWSSGVFNLAASYAILVNECGGQ